MTFLEACWLGVVQGLTEFFPVSSSGHLVIFQSIFGLEEDGGLLFEISVHVATLLAIVAFYHARILELLRGVFLRRSEALVYVGKLAVGTLPAVIVGLSAKDFIEHHGRHPMFTGGALLVTGAILWTTRTTVRGAQDSTPSWRTALLVGCAQAVAILPGISRSGSTVAVALALGMAPAAAAEFSFLLGIIAIAGAAVLMLPELAVASPEQLSALWVGGIAAGVTGLAAIAAFVRLLQGGRFHLFAWYAWAVGSLFLLWLMVGG